MLQLVNVVNTHLQNSEAMKKNAKIEKSAIKNKSLVGL